MSEFTPTLPNLTFGRPFLCCRANNNQIYFLEPMQENRLQLYLLLIFVNVLCELVPKKTFYAVWGK